MCVTRSHPCACPALSRLCPHHAAQRHMRRLHKHLGQPPPTTHSSPPTGKQFPNRQSSNFSAASSNRLTRPERGAYTCAECRVPVPDPPRFQQRNRSAYRPMWLRSGRPPHLPATDKDCINSAIWTTCGWRYATGRYKKTRTKPTTNLCGSCFKFAAQADTDDLSDLATRLLNPPCVLMSPFDM